MESSFKKRADGKGVGGKEKMLFLSVAENV
jgi:hypothetical protein